VVIASLFWPFGAALSDELSSTYIQKWPDSDTVIVFVHGLMGNARSTWTSDAGTYWPTMLAHDSTFRGADIFVYSYPTKYQSTFSIDELAENMREVLVASDVTKYRKIIFFVS
jgi:hypothetical protein